MDGPDILARTLTVPALTGSKDPKLWQYHSRGTRHSITPCWGVLFDLLGESAVLREHVSTGKVVFGLDHQMHDFAADRPKNLDLVIARPTSSGGRTGRTFRDLPKLHRMELTAAQRARLESLPDPEEGPVGAALLALEAKAMFTAYSKSYPRFYDELNSSHRAIHGSSNNALAVGLAIVNVAKRFISPIINPDYPTTGVAKYSEHNQPKDAHGAIEKVRQLPRRTSDDGVGYEGLGIVLVDCVNDGSPVAVADEPKVPDNYRYDRMVTRIANEYDVRFRNI
jgi:hypothetical protein